MSIIDYILLVKNLLVYGVLNTIKKREKLKEKSRSNRVNKKEKIKQSSKSINTHAEVIQDLYIKTNLSFEKLKVIFDE